MGTEAVKIAQDRVKMCLVAPLDCEPDVARVRSLCSPILKVMIFELTVKIHDILSSTRVSVSESIMCPCNSTSRIVLNVCFPACRRCGGRFAYLLTFIVPMPSSVNSSSRSA